jgi:hypothetical protein
VVTRHSTRRTWVAHRRSSATSWTGGAPGGDRLLDGLKQRQAAGPKVRGIHKGEQMDARDYYWQPEFNPDSGLISEAATAVDTLDGFLVQRYASPGLVNDPMAPEFMSPRRANILSRQGGGQGMTPPWSTPPAPVQGGLIGNQV